MTAALQIKTGRCPKQRIKNLAEGVVTYPWSKLHEGGNRLKIWLPVPEFIYGECLCLFQSTGSETSVMY